MENLENKKKPLLLRVMPPSIIAFLILFGTYNVFFSLLALAISALYLLKIDNNSTLTLMFFLMPLAPIFKVSPSSSSLFTFLELGVLFFIYIRTRTVSGKELIHILFFSFYILFFELLYGEFNVTSTIKLIVNILMLFQISRLPKECNKEIFIAYIAGVLCSSFYRLLDSNIFNISAFTSQKMLGFGGGIFITRFSGLYTDPNYYAINVIIALCLIVYLYAQKKVSLLMTIALIIPFCVFAGMTGSKSAVLMLLLPAFELLYLCKKNGNYLILSFLGCSFGLIILGVISGEISIFDTAFERFNLDTGNVDALTTGRTILWRDYMAYFDENLFKTIFGSSIAVTTLRTSISVTEPHNTYLDLILQLGIVGSLLFLSCIRVAFSNSFRRIKRNGQNYILFFVLAVMYCFLSQLQGYDLPFQIGLALILFNSYSVITKSKKGNVTN